MGFAKQKIKKKEALELLDGNGEREEKEEGKSVGCAIIV